MSVFSNVMLPTRIAEEMAVMIPIGAMAKRILSNTEKDDFRNCAVTFSPNSVISGPRSDAALFAKSLASKADVGTKKRAIAVIRIHIIAAISKFMRLESVVAG